MARFGLIEAINAATRGIRLRPTPGAANYVEQRSPSSLASNVTVIWLDTLPSSGTEALTISNTGQIGRQALGGGGSVTSVALSLPSIFSVSGSPVTTSGTLTGTLANQTQNLVFASPNGSTGAPTFRSIVSADIPKTLDATWITDFNTQVRLSRLDQMALPTASVNFNSQRITSVADPVNPQDGATKGYVDATAQGLDVKPSVRSASTANVSIASPGATIDGVTMVVGNRVLLKNQTTTTENGIYIWNGTAVAMTRSTDMDLAAEFPGAFTFVEEGTVNADTGWVCTTNAPVTIGTTPIAFAQFSGAGSIVAGNGLTQTGNQIDVVGTASRISVAADSIDISSAYVGQSSITTLGTITTGTWNGTSIAVANGGTGANTDSGARTNLGAAGVFRQSFTNANLTSGVLTLTHSLNQKIVKIQVSDDTDKVIYPDDITLTSATQSAIDLTSFGTIGGTWNVVACG